METSFSLSYQQDTHRELSTTPLLKNKPNGPPLFGFLIFGEPQNEFGSIPSIKFTVPLFWYVVYLSYSGGISHWTMGLISTVVG